MSRIACLVPWPHAEVLAQRTRTRIGSAGTAQIASTRPLNFLNFFSPTPHWVPSADPIGFQFGFQSLRGSGSEPVGPLGRTSLADWFGPEVRDPAPLAVEVKRRSK